MKKIFTLAAILFSITSFAAERPKPAKLAITSNDRATIQVKIDGVMYNLNRNTFVMDNLRAGSHTIAIYKTDLIGFRKKTALIYNSAFNVSPSQFVDIDINKNGKVKINKSKIDRNDRDDRWKGNDRDYNDRDYRNNNGRY
jgi:hypothetical protein